MLEGASGVDPAQPSAQSSVSTEFGHALMPADTLDFKKVKLKKKRFKEVKCRYFPF